MHAFPFLYTSPVLTALVPPSPQALGESALGGSDVLRPPLVPGGGGRHCHSLVNRTDDPTVFVVQVSSLHLPKRLCNSSTLP